MPYATRSFNGHGNDILAKDRNIVLFEMKLQEHRRTTNKNYSKNHNASIVTLEIDIFCDWRIYNDLDVGQDLASGLYLNFSLYLEQKLMSARRQTRPGLMK